MYQYSSLADTNVTSHLVVDDEYFINVRSRHDEAQEHASAPLRERANARVFVLGRGVALWTTRSSNAVQTSESCAKRAVRVK